MFVHLNNFNSMISIVGFSQDCRCCVGLNCHICATGRNGKRDLERVFLDRIAHFSVVGLAIGVLILLSPPPAGELNRDSFSKSLVTMPMLRAL